MLECEQTTLDDSGDCRRRPRTVRRLPGGANQFRAGVPPRLFTAHFFVNNLRAKGRNTPIGFYMAPAHTP